MRPAGRGPRRGFASRLLLSAMIGALTTSCKVPIVDIEAEFTISDMSWFAAEETLFVFYELEALAGLNESSAVEIQFTTDNLTVDWTPLDEFRHVHTHVSVNCGPSKLCGSASISVNQSLATSVSDCATIKTAN